MGAEQSQHAERRRDFERDEIKLRNLIEKCASLDASHIDSLAYIKSDDFLDITYEQIMFPHKSSPKPFQKYRVKTVNYQPRVDSENVNTYSHLMDVFCETDNDSISSSSYMSLVDQYLAQQEGYMNNMGRDEQTSKMLLRIYLSVAAANKKWKEQQKSDDTIETGSSSTDCGGAESSISTVKGGTEISPRLLCPKASDATEALLITSIEILMMLSNLILPTSTEAVGVLTNLIEALLNQIDDSKLYDGNTAMTEVKPSKVVNEYIFQRMFEIISDKFLISDAQVGSKAISLLLVLAITEANAFSVLKVITLMLEGPYPLEPSVFRLCSKFDTTVLIQRQDVAGASAADVLPPISEVSSKYEQNMPNSHLFLLQALPFAYRKKSLRVQNNDVESSVILLLEFVVKLAKQEDRDGATVSCIESCLMFVSLLMQSSHEYTTPKSSYPTSYVIGDLVQRGDSWKGSDDDKRYNHTGIGTVVGLSSAGAGEMSVRWNESGLLCHYMYNSSSSRTIKRAKCVNLSKESSMTSASKDMLKTLFFEALHTSDPAKSNTTAHASGAQNDNASNKWPLRAVSGTLVEVMLLNMEVLFPKKSTETYSLIRDLLEMFGSNSLDEAFKLILLDKMSAINSSDIIALLNTKVEDQSLDVAPYESLVRDCLKYTKNSFLESFDSAASNPESAEIGDSQVLEIEGISSSSVSEAIVEPVLVASDGNGAELSENNSFVSFKQSHAYVTCPVEMINDDGHWEWELENVFDRPQDEVSVVGVAKLPIINPQYDKSAEIWCVRCYSGETRHNSTTAGRHHVGSRPLTKISVGDFCKFFYNTYTQELSLKVKKKGTEEYQDLGVIFNELPSGISPYIGDYGNRNERNNSKWRIISLSHLSEQPETSETCKSDGLDKLLEGQISRLLDSITIKLILREIDAIMNHYYTTADYSPTAVNVNDSSNNIVTTWRNPSAFPKGVNGETVDTVVDRMCIVILPLLDSLQECLEALAG